VTSPISEEPQDAALVAGFIRHLMPHPAPKRCSPYGRSSPLRGVVPCGGWCPPDREAEDGPIPVRYPLRPLPVEEISALRSKDGGASAARTARQIAERYRARTLKNVQDSDGPVILFSGTLSGGTLLTRNLCVREKKLFVALDAKAMRELRAMPLAGSSMRIIFKC